MTASQNKPAATKDVVRAIARCCFSLLYSSIFEVSCGQSRSLQLDTSRANALNTRVATGLDSYLAVARRVNMQQQQERTHTHRPQQLSAAGRGAVQLHF